MILLISVLAHEVKYNKAKIFLRRSGLLTNK